ncbi:MAG TPA: PAS domain S-box protein [Methylomirabilota bacterium]
MNATSQRPGEAQTLLAIAATLAGVHDLTEALRQTCRHVARLTGAETISAYILDPGRTALVPVAAYRVPKEAVPVLAGQLLPIDAQGFRDSVFAGEVAWSDDVQHDPRFTSPLFRRFPHRSGLIIPLRAGDRVAGAFYLVWWHEPRRFEPAEIATLQAIGQQVGLLVRSSLLLREADTRRTEAEAAEARYRSLLERVPAGVWRTSTTGRILEVNPALVQLLGYPDRAALQARNAADLYVDVADRERLRQTLARDGVADYTAQLRRADGTPLWARMWVRATSEDGQLVYEGVLEDITDRRRAEAAERQAETLRYVAHLANAAAHEINNPLAVITGRLELVRRRLAGHDETLAKMDAALVAARRIADIIAHMGRITRLELHGQTSNVPPMLDIPGSSPPAPDPSESR